MSTTILTKIAKHTLIGSLSAYLAFASKANYQIRLAFIYAIAGIIAVFIIAALWEARDYLTSTNPTEEQLSTIVSGLSGTKPANRKYMLSAQTRLEIVITFVVIVCCALIGAI